MLHTHHTHPWTDNFDHTTTLATARHIARDITTNQRWGRGNEGQPVYDLTDGGHYLGDNADDSVRCRIGGPIVSLYIPRPMSTDEAIELVYTTAIPRALLWQALRDELTAAVAAGRLNADEPLDDAATRLLRNGYTPASLKRELPDPEPVGATEIAERAGVQRDTVDEWQRRHGDFPEPRWTVGGRPAWAWADVSGWLAKTGRATPASR